MKDFVLYCKSYSKDFFRLRLLLQSIEQYNLEQIPFYISTSSLEKSFLEKVLGVKGYTWVADEDIILANPKSDLNQYRVMPGGLSQQIIKAEFWRLGLAENYLCIDSDSKFIRNFQYSDFMTDDKVPYTILHQNKELFQTANNRGHLKVERDLRMEVERVKAFFGRSGPNFYGAPSPFNWSAKVWRSLDEQYLQPKGISIWNLITPEFPESLIYCETLLKYHSIPMIPIEPLFRAYHYDWQFFLMKRLGETEEKLAQNYFGVIYQSAWDMSDHLGLPDKSFFSRLLRRIKKNFRKIEAYF